MFYVIIALLAGVSVVISRMVNYKLAEKIGLLQSTFFNYVVGLVFSIVILLLSKELFTSTIPHLTPIQTFVYLGGVLGVIVVMLSSYMTPRISSFYLTLFIFIGQLFTGGIIDYFTLGQFSLGKIIGGILVLAGLIYNLN